MKNVLVLFALVFISYLPTLVVAEELSGLESSKLPVGKIRLIEIDPKNDIFVELKQSNGASCKTNSYVCNSCSIVCPVGKAAICTPGKAYNSSVSGLKCTEQPKCYCN
ncbi:TPA: hypothetical protein ACN33Q_004776 [Vibrio parahaemolyticus]|uniref:hypothetical protein n=1 Tax=Vibrio parahaemolyticus TaxID=670 RepID=UPI0028092093|nr:hypothetical protein [Vibrio parahaemolyticus]ELA9293044.1 hypothetical protein [Vibrio parahaemolyticus]MDG2749113.1 hypothetical protein [Vibrio parahaemolyticus]